MKYKKIEIISKYLKELNVIFIFNLIENKRKIILIIIYLMNLIQTLFIPIIT